jgi:copper chaperone CopZ
MHCESCSTALASAIRVLPGVSSATADHRNGETRVAYDSAKVQLETIERQIEYAGFDVVSK